MDTPEDHLAPLLDRLGLDRSNWVKTVRTIRPHVQASGRSREFARAGGAALLATLVSGKAAAPGPGASAHWLLTYTPLGWLRIQSAVRNAFV